MERLKGKTILIGKEPGQRRLLVTIAGGKGAAIGMPGSVPNSVSRCKAAEGVAHAAIIIDQSGNMTLKNMKSQNVTYVNGSEIISKRINLNDTVELGKDRYQIQIPTVIETAKRIVASQPKPAPAPAAAPAKQYNISHLERVWNDYHNKNLELKKRQKKQGLYASLPMFFTMGGSVISLVLSFIVGDEYKEEVKVITVILAVLGLVMLIYSFIKRNNDSSIEEQEKMAEDFQDQYVCPNPDCNKFLGNLSYKLMKKQYSMKCPYCNSKFVEK